MKNLIVGPSYGLRRKIADTQRSINLMPSTGRAQMYLQPVPGLTTFSLVPAVEPPSVTNRMIGFLTWARGIRDGSSPVEYISEIGPDLIGVDGGYGPAIYNASGGMVFGTFELSNPAATFTNYLSPDGDIAEGLVQDELGNPRAWRMEAWGLLPTYAGITIYSSGGGLVIAKIAIQFGGNFVVTQRTPGGFSESIMGSSKPSPFVLAHFAIEKRPGELMTAWCKDIDGNVYLNGGTWGNTDDWTDAYINGMTWIFGGGTFSQGRFAVWFDPEDDELFSVGGYNPENPLSNLGIPAP